MRSLHLIPALICAFTGSVEAVYTSTWTIERQYATAGIVVRATPLQITSMETKDGLWCLARFDVHEVYKLDGAAIAALSPSNHTTSLTVAYIGRTATLGPRGPQFTLGVEYVLFLQPKVKDGYSPIHTLVTDDTKALVVTPSLLESIEALGAGCEHDTSTTNALDTR